MTNIPKLTIITITKNDPDGLARTLASASGLRAAGAEHLVIDGGVNPVTTPQLINTYGEMLSVYAQPPRGISDAFNCGLAEAHGEWVLFLNGGDAIHDHLNIEWLLGHLAATGADVVTGSVQFDGEPAARPRPHLSYQWPLISCWLGHQATFIRRGRLIEAGGFNPRWRIAMDYDLWFRLLSQPAVVDVVSIPIVRFDVTGISENLKMRKAARREEAQVVLTHSAALAWSGVWLCLRLARRLTWAVTRWSALRPEPKL